MPRKSERELKRAVERLAPGDAPAASGSVLVTFLDAETGEHRTPEGEVVDPDAHGPFDLTVSIGGEPIR